MTVNEKEITLYYPDGKIIPSMKEFLDFYNKCYYLSNNIEVEEKIKDILYNGMQSDKDLFRVLAWKFGKINMKRSTKDAFVYYENMNEEEMQLRIYSKEDIMNKSDIERIYKTIENYNDKCDSDEEAQSFLNKIETITKDKNWGEYFYSVYMITLLYFVSKGKYPIVDSFSYVALDAIDNNIKYGKRKSYPGLPKRDKTEFDEIITKGTYKGYRDNLKKLFGKKANSREVDQALWTYGKLFKS